MTRKRRRLWLVAACGLALGGAATLTLSALRSDLVFFVTPSDLAENARPGQPLRLGGLVERGSVRREARNGEPVAEFRITDGHGATAVRYVGILPDLFREGQGVVTLGTYGDGVFTASEVLAKHDEKYMPKDVADALKRRGEFRPDAR